MKFTKRKLSIFILICTLLISCSDEWNTKEIPSNQLTEKKQINALIEYAKQEFSSQNETRSTSDTQVNDDATPLWSDYKILKQSNDTVSIVIPINAKSEDRESYLVVNEVASSKGMFRVKMPGADISDLPLNVQRRVLVNINGEEVLCRFVLDKNGNTKIARLRNTGTLRSGINGGTLPEVVVYPGIGGYDANWWWYDYMYGLISFPPPPNYTGYVPPVSPTTPQDSKPDYKKAENIAKNPTVKQAMEDILKKTKEDASKDKGRRERGFWVFYDEKTKTYYKGNEKIGEYVKGGEGTKASVNPGGANPASNGNHIPKTAIPVTFVHSHTPLTYEENCQREVGPSPADKSLADEWGIDIIVIDYQGVEDDNGKYYIQGGHDINAQTKEYIYSGKSK